MHRSLLINAQHVDHYHFQGWPDYGLPSDFSEFKHLVDITTESLLRRENKVLIHCRGGFGRTGTTIAIVNALLSIKTQQKAGIEDPLLSIYSIVKQLRQQRLNLVEEPAQYNYIFQYLR